MGREQKDANILCTPHHPLTIQQYNFLALTPTLFRCLKIFTGLFVSVDSQQRQYQILYAKLVNISRYIESDKECQRDRILLS